MKQKIVDAIVAELRRQSEESRDFQVGPFYADEAGSELTGMVDGSLDIVAMAEALEKVTA